MLFPYEERIFLEEKKFFYYPRMQQVNS